MGRDHMTWCVWSGAITQVMPDWCCCCGQSGERSGHAQEGKLTKLAWLWYSTCAGTPALSKATLATRPAVSTPANTSFLSHISMFQKGKPAGASSQIEVIITMQPK